MCSSIFVTDIWISYLSSEQPAALFHPLDIRRSISSQFQLLAAFCRASHQAVSDALFSLTTTQLITPKMLSHAVLNAQMETIVDRSRTNLLAEQRRTNRLIRSVNELNQLPTALSTNYLYTASFTRLPQLYFLE